ncbi:complement C1q-like protein 2 [Perca fluviatilis]|uniref:complement C1q-like protein 2 n=1 Tax=Perca fluviatilis TaxID=8168 RepID=UPI001965BBCF|nr:complement C1q-like protein 2 [Perca fluviatilis]
MKISVSFLLLLLLGAVPASESQPMFPSHINTVLIQMSAWLVQMKADMTTGLAQLKAEVNTLKQQLQVQEVAFSVALLAGSGTATTGPFPMDTTLVYKYIPTNIGNAYNPNTGFFTAPVRGAYNFEWSVGAFGDGSHGSGAWLVKNSEKVFLAFEQQKDGFMSSSKGVTLLLEVGDIVYVLLVANNLAFDDYNHHTTFSGFLLFPM